MCDKDIIIGEYRTALEDLSSHRKPLITMLTMLADEGKEYASGITQAVNTHIKDVPNSMRLPGLFLIDSIVKNVGEYKRHFSISIAKVFPSVFKDADEKNRKKMFELRQTWNGIFPKSSLYLLDCNVQEIDPGWPITSQSSLSQTPKIHIDPKFRAPTIGYPSTSKTPPASAFIPAANSSTGNSDMEELKTLQNQKKVLAEARNKVEMQMLKDSKVAAPDSKSLVIPEVPLSVVPLNPFEKCSDEDMRNPLIKALQDTLLRKTSSPQTENWKKFKAENPETREYNRQASFSGCRIG